ncbi:Zinc finger protein 638 [Larimichthys crocea]|uniref:Zinc finger protein 638 n=1 Tax=Larimichthys crocea TaxID=215358 RepID=A0A6G0HK05_LARCR|nr:Zinc finger protein 638 [Larimichthys crocea]
MSQSMSYMPEQGITTIDEDLKRSVDMHISRAREEVRVLHQHQSIDQDTRFTSTRHEFQSLGTGMVSYLMCSTSPSLGHRHMEIESGGTSLVWSSNYKRPTPDDSKFNSSSVSSNSASGKDDRFSPHSEIERGMQSIPGLGDYDRPVPDRTVAPTEPIQPKYTSESAANILLHFGLEKEDLEHLICYPEDQITPANLPYIMREIRIKKAKMATTKVQDKPYPKPQPSHSLSSSASSAVLQPSQVIEYGHTSKCTGGVGAEIGRISASGANSGGDGHMLLSDIYVSNSQEPLQEKNTTGVNSSVLGSSAEQESSVTSLSSSYSPGLNSVAPPCHDQTKQLQTQSNQTSQTNLNSFVLPKKDTDLRVLESEASEPVPVKEPEADCQSTSKTQPPCTPLFRGVYPDRPALVLIGSNNTGTKDQSKNQGKGSTVPKQMKKQQIQQFKKPEEQELKWPVLQPGQAMWPPVFSSAKLVPPAPLNPITPDASQGMQHPMVLPDDARSMVIPPVLPPVISNLMRFNHMKPGPSNKQPLAVSKGIPVTATFHDYIATMPRTFPHSCSLCNKECTHMKDWITHQNSSLHLENCKFLQSRLTSKNVKSLASTSAQTFQNRHQKNSRGSRSRSRSSSPIRRRGLEGRRERRRSLSRSPHRSKYAHRSRSRSSSRSRSRSRSSSSSSSSSRSRSRSPRYYRRIPSRYRSRSRSPERRSSPRRKDERRSSPRRNDKRRSSLRRNDKRQSSPRRSDKRRSSPRRNDERRSSPRRNDERRSSPRRNDERRSSPRRNDERRSSPRRSDRRRSSPRRSHERQSTEGSSPQRKKLSNAEKLAKKLLETSAVQSLSKQSDLETVVKTLAPLLAELTKMKSSSSNSSLSSSEGKEPSLSPAGGKRSSSTVSFSSPQKSEAIVHFEKEKDAKKLRCVKTFDVKRLTVNVVREKETDLNKQENPPQKSTVKHFETLKSLKQRLQDSSELTINFEPHGTTPSDVAMDTSNLKLIKRARKNKEGENIKSAATVKVSMGTDLEPLKEQAKAIEGAVAKSDHKVSAESIAAKSVESETKLETSSEMHPPREHGEDISQAQSLEMNVNLSTLKDQKMNKEEGKEDDADKRIEDKEDENDSENYQILNPCDDRAEEQLDDGDRVTILVQDDSCAVKQLSEEDANPDIDKSDDEFFYSGKDERPSNRSGDPAAPKKEETEKSPKKQDKEVKKYEMRTKKDTTAGVSKDDKEATEEDGV